MFSERQKAQQTEPAKVKHTKLCLSQLLLEQGEGYFQRQVVQSELLKFFCEDFEH